MLPQVSVIVPVYNVAEYLPECIESIINQTYKNLEIILVDDGSTESSGQICDEYATKDCRIKVVHKENGGLSDARNTGLDICRGEYIGFVDSDDYIAKDMYETLYGFLKEKDLDVAMCATHDLEKNHKSACEYFAPKVLDGKNEIIEEIFVNKCGGAAISVCNKIYKREILEDIRFEKNKFYEDAFFALKWIEKTKRFGRISEGKYFYLQREGSITHQRKFRIEILHIVDAYSENFGIIKDKYPECIEAGECRLWWSYKVALDRSLECSDYNDYLDSIIDLQKRIKSNWRKVLSNKYLRKKEKLGLILLSININLYQTIKRIKRQLDKLKD